MLFITSYGFIGIRAFLSAIYTDNVGENVGINPDAIRNNPFAPLVMAYYYQRYTNAVWGMVWGRTKKDLRLYS